MCTSSLMDLLWLFASTSRLISLANTSSAALQSIHYYLLIQPATIVAENTTQAGRVTA